VPVLPACFASLGYTGLMGVMGLGLVFGGLYLVVYQSVFVFLMSLEVFLFLESVSGDFRSLFILSSRSELLLPKKK